MNFTWRKEMLIVLAILAKASAFGYVFRLRCSGIRPYTKSLMLNRLRTSGKSFADGPCIRRMVRHRRSRSASLRCRADRSQPAPASSDGPEQQGHFRNLICKNKDRAGRQGPAAAGVHANLWHTGSGRLGTDAGNVQEPVTDAGGPPGMEIATLPERASAGWSERAWSPKLPSTS